LQHFAYRFQAKDARGRGWDSRFRELSEEQ
jgi:hypothetical protein